MDLNATSNLHVGQVDSNSVFDDLGQTALSGRLYLNDNHQPLGHRLEISSWALAAENFVAKKEVCVGTICATLFSATFDDVSSYLPRRGHAVVTSAFDDPSIRFNIGVGMIGIGVLATTNGSPGEARFLNQGEVTGSFDLTNGAFSLDANGQDLTFSAVLQDDFSCDDPPRNHLSGWLHDIRCRAFLCFIDLNHQRLASLLGLSQLGKFLTFSGVPSLC